VGAIILSKVPDTNTSATVTANDLALVGVNHDIVDWAAVRVASLNSTSTSLPDLDSAILGACNHPLALTMECDTGDVAGVALKGEKRIRVGRLDIIQFDSMMAGGGEESLVRRDAEAIDLRVGVLDSAGADTRQGFPETVLILALG
jgi:hypothetical protein